MYWIVASISVFIMFLVLSTFCFPHQINNYQNLQSLLFLILSKTLFSQHPLIFLIFGSWIVPWFLISFHLCFCIYIADLLFWLHIVVLFLPFVFKFKLFAFLFLQYLLNIVSRWILSHLWTIYHPSKRNRFSRVIISFLSPVSLDHNICFLLSEVKSNFNGKVLKYRTCCVLCMTQTAPESLAYRVEKILDVLLIHPPKFFCKLFLSLLNFQSIIFLFRIFFLTFFSFSFTFFNVFL